MVHVVVAANFLPLLLQGGAIQSKRNFTTAAPCLGCSLSVYVVGCFSLKRSVKWGDNTIRMSFLYDDYRPASTQAGWGLTASESYARVGGPMSHIDVPLSRSGFGRTQRADNWWIQPLAVFLALSAFIIYATWAAFQGQHFRFGPYLSPFYSPQLFGDPNQGWFGSKPTWMPVWVTAAMLILWAPGGFRVTC